MQRGLSERLTFEEYYRCRWPDVAKWAAALCGNVHLGEELAQEAFLHIESRYDAIQYPDAYLRQTLTNVVNDHYRSASRREKREEHVARCTSSPEDVDGVPSSDLLKVLYQLPHRQRQVLVLRYWADWDDDMISSAMHCRRSTVRSLAKRALDQLRHVLKEQRNEEST